MNPQLADKYYDAALPGSYAGASTFLRQPGNRFDRDEAEAWFRTQDAYTLHKDVRRRFPRRRTYAKGIDDLWQADLADMNSLANENDGHRYLLTVIDAFSKRAWAIPVKNKTGANVAAAFSKILEEGRQPALLQTDKGTEFLNETFQALLRRLGIHHYTSENDDIKAAIVERFNRTLKTRIWRYMTRANSTRYVDALPDIVRSYNRTTHRSIGVAPEGVTPANEEKVRARLFPPQKRPTKFKYPMGQSVRISKTRRTFHKGYLPSWTEELFRIVQRVPSKPVTYKIADAAGETLKGSFYEQELQPVDKTDDVYKVEKVLKTRKRGNKKEYFVKWLGYPDKFNSWVTELL